ncbi:hypothetical protein MTO96_022388 [Rhipicephalus appendiculatus]
MGSRTCALSRKAHYRTEKRRSETLPAQRAAGPSVRRLAAISSRSRKKTSYPGRDGSRPAAAPGGALRGNGGAWARGALGPQTLGARIAECACAGSTFSAVGHRVRLRGAVEDERPLRAPHRTMGRFYLDS